MILRPMTDSVKSEELVHNVRTMLRKLRIVLPVLVVVTDVTGGVEVVDTNAIVVVSEVARCKIQSSYTRSVSFGCFLTMWFSEHPTLNFRRVV